MRRHVIVNLLLKIKLERVAIGADDDIDTDPAFARHIAAGIVQRDIGAIIAGRDADLRSRMYDQFGGFGFADTGNAGQQRQREETLKTGAAGHLHALNLLAHYGMNWVEARRCVSMACAPVAKYDDDSIEFFSCERERAYASEPDAFSERWSRRDGD